MNRLAQQSSPYLRQHADNPVDWYPWGAEALALARETDRPILLSIGYSACHWCHVMAHESFEDAATSALMNAHCVNIKVDREERPDLDRLYQTAHQLLTRNRGGWPLTLFLTPGDQVPFFGGTYFPREPRHGLPGFKDVIMRVAAAYREHRDQIGQYKAEMKSALAQAMSGAHAPAATLDDAPINEAVRTLAETFDPRAGGFGGAPKFPHPSSLELLFTLYARAPAAAGAAVQLRWITHTLSAMAAGGIFDQLAGGFCRYSVDAEWNIPHFEKMLYDNGPLLGLYAQAWRATGEPRYREVAQATVGWALRDMRVDGGGFCASLDADSEGEEGLYYVWSRAEVSELLGADFALFARRYGLDGPANFEQRWHLRLAPDAPAVPPPDEASALARARGVLLERRRTRPLPGRDDKVLVAWNALMIRGLATCGRIFADAACIAAAGDAAAYLARVHWRDGRLLATSSGGRATLDAYLDDYAFLCAALLELLAARWERRWLDLAIDLAEVLLAQFEDRQYGGFFFTAHDHEALLERSKTYADEALPAGNALAASALLELGHLLGEPRYLDAGERTLKAAAPAVATYPAGHAATLTALTDFLDPPTVVVMRSDDARAIAEWQTLVELSGDLRARCYVVPCSNTRLPGVLAERAPVPGAIVTAYVCVGTACRAPVTAREAFIELLGERQADS